MAAAEQHAQGAEPQRDGDISGQIAKGAREAGEALAKEFAKDITAAEPAGDPEVMVAFALGWQMSELYRPGSWNARDAKPEDDLPGLGALGGKERAQLGLKQIEVGLKKLEPALKNAGPDVPSVASATGAIPVRPDDPYKQAIFDLHVSLLTTLTAAHFKLGKAYGPGRALSDTTRPNSFTSLKDELEPHRVTNLTNWLSDLTSLFPPHAGHVVHDRVEAWRNWANEDGQSDPEGKAVSLLHREGQRWRAVLSGEKSAKDALKLEDYVAAGELALSHTGTLARGFGRRYKWAIIGSVSLFGVGLGLMIWDPTAGSIAAGLAGILASLGVAWKGVGASLGNSAAKMERPVWEGALDTQIAKSISLLPGSDPASNYITPDPPLGPAEPDTDNGETT
jgi:hypothetical protein